jgi:hypothetical protein
MDKDLISRAWREARGTAPPRDLPHHPVDALAALVPDEPVELAGGIVLGGCADLPPDPWHRMIVGRETELPKLVWVFETACLLPIGRARDDAWLAVDQEEDDAERNRVYLIDAEGASARTLFKSIPDLLKWIAAQGRLPKLSNDAWSKRPASVEACFAPLSALHPARLFESWRTRKLPAGPEAEPAFSPGEPGWRRTASLWTLAHFWISKESALPPGLTAGDVATSHRALLRHLTDLAEAMEAGEVPALVADLALHEDADIAQAALDWMLAFDAARPPVAKPQESAVAERTQGLLLLLQKAVDDLMRLGAIEVPAKSRDRLVEDLLEALVKASNASQIVPLLIESLIESSLVEEVYADDSRLERILEAALGMRK